ncbi:MAG TPA: bifunctional oligoribonuclease/PAP phosphatase NrnA [bacterium]|nr:bifunctional oligoribonuclease/PAP phosphatase NrnA [bacterium]
MNEYESFIGMLKKGESFVVASHYSPDGDAIGSTIAMGMLLSKLGKKATLYNRDGVPANLSFLPNANLVSSSVDFSKSYDMAIMVDCGQRKRISDEFAGSKGFSSVVCVDHHLLDDCEADVTLLDSAAASTGEVVLRLMRRAGFEPDSGFAQCIYTTLVVDTGFFKYSSTTAESFALASDLVRAGANPWNVSKHLEESHPACRMKLLALSLASLDISQEGRYASMDVTQGMLSKAGATMELSDEFATYPRAIEGVEVSALFREMEDGRTKVSMRSKDFVDVAALARTFGGGGHVRAAGFRVKGSVGETKARVAAAVSKVLAELPR